ncbi:zinc/iron transporter protein [Apiospora aurea]|uniref:Zinc/iron transporter protein n=1 Tax=Apiospora aurea TaxID=335848 RepID=A0ABR1PXJ1_9PEZI
MARGLCLYDVLAILGLLVSFAYQSPLNPKSVEVDTVLERTIQSRVAADFSTPSINLSGLGGEFGVGKERHCHFHAGVEHCEDEQETGGPLDCELVKRHYNIPLRWGMVAAVLVASAIGKASGFGHADATPREGSGSSMLTRIPGVYSPIIMRVNTASTSNALLAFIKQFGTGVVISTAFIHVSQIPFLAQLIMRYHKRFRCSLLTGRGSIQLFTHASLMFQNRCLGEIDYEATPAAILLAGVFVSFAVDFFSHRFFSWRQADEQQQANSELVNIFVLESGIMFHSLLIGVTLVVTGDSFFVTLAVVIGFHQLFEGIALGSRIAELGLATVRNMVQVHVNTGPSYGTVASAEEEAPLLGSGSQAPTTTGAAVSARKKFAIASGFAFITPLGMILGMAVLHRFNGNDPFTIIALGSLDAFSAGILVWTGVVEMWAKGLAEGRRDGEPEQRQDGAGVAGTCLRDGSDGSPGKVGVEFCIQNQVLVTHYSCLVPVYLVSWAPQGQPIHVLTQSLHNTALASSR